ncbi:MAG: hypothetical protein M3Y37_09455 [Chloroflexota bacterium]|nr:hypothetical protein [Chloroflexota bacterium]
MSKPGQSSLFDLYEKLDRLEELLEDMEEFGVASREDVERLIAELDEQIEELEAQKGDAS